MRIKNMYISAIFCMAGMGFGGGGLAHADPVRDMLDCADIAADSDRLACFDATVKAAGGAQAENRQVTREEKVASFGKSQLKDSPVTAVKDQLKQEEKQELDSIRLKATRHDYTATRKFVIFLENGQIWKQKDSGYVHLPDGDFEVEIKKGAFGSFNMIVPTKKSLIKVTRLK